MDGAYCGLWGESVFGQLGTKGELGTRGNILQEGELMSGILEAVEIEKSQ